MNASVWFSDFLSLSSIFSSCRTSWFEGAASHRAAADEDNLVAARSRDLQRGGPTQSALLQPFTWETAGAAISKRPRLAEDLLPEAGGSGSGTATDREHVCRKFAVLKWR